MLTTGGTVTVMFTDLVGSTAILDRMGDEKGEEFRQAHFRVLRDAIDEHGGQEIKNLGDGLMVVFPSAVAGSQCAVTMHRTLSRLGDDLGESLELRIGINVGEVINAEDDFFGTPVVIAKRLCDRAEPGQTLVTDLLKALVGARGGFRFSELGALALKGFADPVNALELTGSPEGEGDSPGVPLEPAADLAVEAHPLPRSIAHEARGPLAGRTPELETLRAEMQTAFEGSLRMVVIGGEPGIGKTRLASEIAMKAHADGAAVLFGRSDPEQLVSFQPFVEAIGDYLAGVSDRRARGRFGKHLPGLCRLIPAASERFPDLAASWVTVDSETDRYRLFEAATGVLKSLAEESGLVLVLDDMHWADRTTLALVRHLARSAEFSKMLVVGTYRDVEVGRDHPLGQIIAERHRGAPINVIPLQGLSYDELRVLASNWAGRKVPDALVRALWEDTEGHPFFAQEVLRHLLSTGVIRERRGRLIPETAGIPGTAIPLSVREVIEQRLNRWSDEDISLLRIAAVSGRDFDCTLVEKVAGEDRSDRLWRLLDEASAAQIVAPVPATPDRYRFTHALIRDVLYEGLSPAWRVRLHQRVAQTLEEANPDNLPLAELARHYFAAASANEAFSKAVDYGLAAGRAAASALAYEEAAVHFERVLKALELRGGTERLSAEVLVALGASRWAVGEFAASRRAFSKAADLADSARDPVLLAQAALGFAGHLGFQAGVIDTEVIELLERALDRLKEGHSRLKAKVMARLCEAMTLVAPFERRAELGRQALELARAEGDDETLIYVLSRTRFGTAAHDNLAESMATVEELFERATALGDPRLILEACFWLRVTCIQAGDVDRAAALDNVIRETMAGSRDRYLRWFDLSTRAVLAFQEAHTDDLESLMWLTLEAGQAAQNSTAVAVFGAHLLYLRYLQGRLAEVHATAVSIAEHFHDVVAFRAALAFVDSELGLMDSAMDEIDRLAAKDFSDLPKDFFWLSAVDVLAIACSNVRDRRRAKLLYDLILPFSEQTIVIGGICASTGSVHAYLGLLATTIEEFEDAERHFQASFEWDLAGGAQVPYLRSRADYVELLLRRGAPGDREQAERVIEETTAGCRELGLDGLAKKLRAQHAILTGEESLHTASAGSRLRSITGGAKAALTIRGRNAVGRMVSSSSDEELQRRFESALAQRTLLTAMAQGFQPRMGLGFEGEIELGLSKSRNESEETRWWTLAISPRHASARAGRAEDPAVTIETDVATFLRLFTGDLNPLSAWLAGVVAISGDITLGPRMIELFGGVRPFDVA